MYLVPAYLFSILLSLSHFFFPLDLQMSLSDQAVAPQNICTKLDYPLWLTPMNSMNFCFNTIPLKKLFLSFLVPITVKASIAALLLNHL